MKSTIFMRMLLATLGPLLLVFILLLIVADHTIYKVCSTFALKIVEQEAGHAARHLAGKLGAIFGAVELTNKQMGELPVVGGDIPEKLETLLARLMDIAPEFSNVWATFEPGAAGEQRINRALTREGDTTARKSATLVAEVVKDPARVPWQTGYISSDVPYVDMAGEVEYSPYPRKIPGISIVVPVLCEGRLVGALGGNVNYKDIFNSKLPLTMYSGQVSLISAAGKIYYSEHAAREGKNIFDGSFQEKNFETLKKALAQRGSWTGEGRFFDSPDDFLIYLEPVAVFGIGASTFLYLTTPSKNIYAASRMVVWTLACFGVLAIFLIGTCVFVAVKSIVRPITDLADDFGKVSAGDIEYTLVSQEVKTGSMVELNMLRTAFATMLRQITQTQALSLETANQHLGNLVQEKAAAALQARNEIFPEMAREMHTPIDTPGFLETAKEENLATCSLGVKVLVVDDNEINLAAAETLLTDLYNFRCDLACSGVEALQKCAVTEYRLIFMDQRMPEMDGLETTRRIRESGGKNAGVPIIALTANTAQGAREMLLQGGMDDYLAKPVQADALEIVLARWLPGEWEAPEPVCNAEDSAPEI